MLQEKLKVGSLAGVRTGAPALWLIGIAVLLVIAALWFVLLGPGRKFLPGASGGDLLKNTRQATLGSIDLRISATGIIKPVNQVKISPKITGLLKELLVEQGDFVKEGQLLAIMDDSNLVGQVQSARAAHLVARSNYEKSLHGNRPQEIAHAAAMLQKSHSQVNHAERAISRTQAQLKSVQAQVERDETNARRLTELASQGAISDQERLNATTQAQVSRSNLQQVQQEYQQAESFLLQAKADLEAAQQQYNLMKSGSRQEDKQAAHDVVVQAEGNLKYLESQLNDTRIRAPFDGVISQKYTDEGGIVTPTTSAATTSATSSSIVSLAGRLELVASVSETDINNVVVGQKVEIIANAYPDKSFQGTVTRIAPEAIVMQNVTTFEVHASIDSDSGHMLMSGMNVSAQFLSGKKNNMLLIPTACIISKQGRTGVLVPDKDGEPEFKMVKIGPTSGTQTAVLDGLKVGERVFLGLSKAQLEEHGYADDKWAPGMGGGNKGQPQMPRSFRPK